jgi:katanin p80 WD40 repeat-containing subunit B1
MVNVWAIGKPQAILQLSGHVTGIECVSMDWPEELVVAGSAGGSIKLWDLAEAKGSLALSSNPHFSRTQIFHYKC